MLFRSGYRRFLTASGDAFAIDWTKVEEEARYDGKWVLITNTDLAPDQVALRYKQLWMVEDVFRSMKSLLETRPIWHKCDETIRGHVFCSFLALVLRKELQDRMAARGLRHEWADVIHALRGLREIDLTIQGKEVIIRPQATKVAADAYATFGLALPPVVRFRT